MSNPNIELALKWAENECIKNDNLIQAICKLLDAVPYDDLLAYMEERDEREEREEREEEGEDK